MDDALRELVDETAAQFSIPGTAVGVLLDGRELCLCHGVTSVENPLPVDEETLFGIGSVSKTFTATALMRLVAEGRIELGAPVRDYIPELRLADEKAAEMMTVLSLLNHSSGLDWGLQVDTGEGDDALANYVVRMDKLAVIAPPSTRASYSQAAYNLAGRIIEVITGQTFEDAIASLLFEPLGLAHSFYGHEEVMTRRFTVAHNREDDGSMSVLRLRRRPRGDNPGGGLASSIGDQLRWARFHLGDGRSATGTPLLPAEHLQQMQRPTIALRGSNLGDAIGICWFLREIDECRTVGHGGSTNGQFAELLLVPERDFAVVSLSNAGPDGILFNQAVVAWALENYLGLSDHEPELLPFDTSRAEEFVGAYENDVMTLTIERNEGALRLEVLMKPETRAAYKEAAPDHEPFEFGFLSGHTDEYIITSGAFKGQRGFFTRDAQGNVEGVDLAGRLFNRVPADAGRNTS
jgi:CubicO group peptidase (beta-lactamase class C family)